MTCKTCKFWQNDDSLTTVGECRRYPPRAFIDPKDELRAHFPGADPDDWCGEHQVRAMKITPETIEAGVDQLLAYNINFDDPSEVVQRVLKACLSVAR